jgi:hypothetical protein
MLTSISVDRSCPEDLFNSASEVIGSIRELSKLVFERLLFPSAKSITLSQRSLCESSKSHLQSKLLSSNRLGVARALKGVEV